MTKRNYENENGCAVYIFIYLELVWSWSRDRGKRIMKDMWSIKSTTHTHTQNTNGNTKTEWAELSNAVCGFFMRRRPRRRLRNNFKWVGRSARYRRILNVSDSHKTRSKPMHCMHSATNNIQHNFTKTTYPLTVNSVAGLKYYVFVRRILQLHSFSITNSLYLSFLCCSAFNSTNIRWLYAGRGFFFIGFVGRSKCVPSTQLQFLSSVLQTIFVAHYYFAWASQHFILVKAEKKRRSHYCCCC